MIKFIRLFILSLFCLFVSMPLLGKCPINVTGKEAMSMGIYIAEIKSSNTLIDYQSERVYSPASVTKALTTATAFSLLPQNLQLETKVNISGEIVNKTLYGDLIIYAVGDATLESKHFPENCGFCDSIINAIKSIGISKIEGRCCFIPTDFKQDCGVNPNWEIEDIAWGYGTGLYPFNYKDNVFSLSINSSTVTTSPLIKDLIIKKIPLGEDLSTIYMRPFNSNELIILGNSKRNVSNICSTPYPEDVFIDELLSKMKDAGIYINQSHIENSEYLKQRNIYTHKSPKIVDICKSLMVRSDNLFAESILRVISKGNPINVAIDTELNYWKNKGLNTNFITIRDGSGLSRTNRLSPRFVAQVLTFMAKSDYSNEYINCFPKSGKDGTLANFLKGSRLEGKLALKTGSMNGVQCYAGYKLDENSEPTHVIVIMVNHFFCPRRELRCAIENLLLNVL